MDETKKETDVTEGLFAVWSALNVIALILLVLSIWAVGSDKGAIFVYEEKIAPCPEGHPYLDSATDNCYAKSVVDGSKIKGDWVPRADIQLCHTVLDYFLTLFFLPVAVSFEVLKVIGAVLWKIMMIKIC